jgi:hypothetical protein
MHGPGTVKGNIVDPGAVVSPSSAGSTPGTLSVEGEYAQHLGGTLALHLAGTASAHHDKLAVTGTASISGAAAAITNVGYAPTVPTTVPDVLDAGSLTGTFASVGSSGAPTGTAWQAGYRSGAVDMVLGSTGGAANPKPGISKSHPKVKLKGAHVSSKGLVLVLVGNSSSFPIEALSLDLKTTRGARKGGARPTTVASSRPGARIAAGRTGKLSVRLNHSGTRLLDADAKLPVMITLRVSAPDGSQATVSGRATLRAPAGG